jgi:hypothetical protein
MGIRLKVPLILSAALSAVATTAVATEGLNYSPISKQIQGVRTSGPKCGGGTGWCCFRNDKGTITCMCVENWNLKGFGCK